MTFDLYAQSICLRVIHVRDNKDGPLHLNLELINPYKTLNLAFLSVTPVVQACG